MAIAAKALPVNAPTLYEFVGAPAANSASCVAANDEPDNPVIPEYPLGPQIGTAVNRWLDYPRHYFGRTDESDLRFIMRCMRQIPGHPKQLKHFVSLHYEHLYQSTTTGDRRRVANTWLHDVAKAYRARRGL